jgi:glycosyltransferase involved in cell wall biosynthesis
MYRAALAGASSVFFQNNDNLQTLSRAGILPSDTPTKVVAGSGVDLSHFSPAQLPAQISVLMIARLLGDKGAREYAAAAAEIRQSRPDILFKLVGWFDEGNPDSISRSEMDSWIRSGAIEYLGAAQDVRPALRNCSIYVLPSYHEGMPRSVLEALATGRPVITTDVPGCRETVAHGVNGLLVPPRNPSALADALTVLVNDPSLCERMGVASLALAQKKFDVNIVTAQMIETMDLGS